MSNIKQIQATIPYRTFNSMVMNFEINNQEDMDALIQNLIEQALDQQEDSFYGEYYEHSI